MLSGEPMLYLLEHVRFADGEASAVDTAIADALRTLPATVAWEEA